MMQYLCFFCRLKCNNYTIIAIILLLFQGLLLIWSAFCHSPVHQEVFHLPAGLSHWELSRFDLCRVNPPLIRTIAAIPVLAIEHKTNYVSYTQDPLTRAEYSVGLDMMRVNDYRFVWLVIYGRLFCIPIILFGGWICYLWANQLYGKPCGLIALCLWCFCPYILGHGSLLTPDAHASALGIVSAYFFWQWLNKPSWLNVFVAGITLGLAELSKFTLLIFYPLWLVLWIICYVLKKEDHTFSKFCRRTFMIITIFIVSFVIINIGYEFEDSFKPLGKFKFQSSMLTGLPLSSIPKEGANRFVGTCLEDIPFFLPANFLQGMDTQKIDFERGFDSYLFGQWQKGGWWYFHLYALIIKLPIGVLLLMVLSIGLMVFKKEYRSTLHNEIVLFFPIGMLLIILSWQSGIGLHSRYALPLLPFLFISTAKVGRSFELRNYKISLLVSIGIFWATGSTLWNYPNDLSYFNEFVGGSKNGFKYLAKSDCSWGQDLLLLKKWTDKNPDVNGLKIAHSGPFDPRLLGYKFQLPASGIKGNRNPGTLPHESLGPVPGWYAIEVCFLYGDDQLPASDGKGGWDEPSKVLGYDLSYFMKYKPVKVIGNSIYIYHITPEEANRVRREMGLPEIDEAETSEVAHE